MLSIIIPAFNEESRLPPYLSNIIIYLERRGGASEVIVVDEGSRDGTVKAVLALAGASVSTPDSPRQQQG